MSEATLSSIKKAILFAIILFVIISVAFPPIVDNFARIFGIDIPQAKPPVYHSTGDYKEVLCSTRAIQFASDIVAIEKMQGKDIALEMYKNNNDLCTCNWDYDNTADFGREECKEEIKSVESEELIKTMKSCYESGGVSFGQACVKCDYNSGKGRVLCDITQIILPEDTNGLKDKLVKEHWVSAKTFSTDNSGPDFLLNYGKFPLREASSWVLSYAFPLTAIFGSIEQFQQSSREVEDAIRSSTLPDSFSVSKILPYEIGGLSFFGGSAEFQSEPTHDFHVVSKVLDPETSNIEGRNSKYLYQIPFYLASPCKTDVLVYQADCSCEITPDVVARKVPVMDSDISNGRVYYRYTLYDKNTISGTFTEHYTFDDLPVGDLTFGQKEVVKNLCNPNNLVVAPAKFNILLRNHPCYTKILEYPYLQRAVADYGNRVFKGEDAKKKEFIEYYNEYVADESKSDLIRIQGILDLFVQTKNRFDDNMIKEGYALWDFTREVYPHYLEFDDSEVGKTVDLSKAIKAPCYEDRIAYWGDELAHNVRARCIYIVPYGSSYDSSYNNGENFCYTRSRTILNIYDTIKKSNSVEFKSKVEVFGLEFDFKKIGVPVIGEFLDYLQKIGQNTVAGMTNDIKGSSWPDTQAKPSRSTVTADI